MSRRGANFIQADIARAIRAVEQVDSRSVEVTLTAPDGTVIRVAPRDEPRSPPVPVAPEKDWSGVKL